MSAHPPHPTQPPPAHSLLNGEMGTSVVTWFLMARSQDTTIFIMSSIYPFLLKQFPVSFLKIM